MTPQDIADFIAQQWLLHSSDIHDWITDHRGVLLLIAALLSYLWVRDQKRREKI